MTKWRLFCRSWDISGIKYSFKKPLVFYFPLYQKCSIGIVILDLALPSLPHIIQLFMKSFFILLGYITSLRTT